MENTKIRCVRCKGRKKMFKMNNGYTHTNMGAPEVECPLCLGKGFTLPLEAAIEEIKKAKKIKEKDFKDENERRESAE